MPVQGKFSGSYQGGKYKVEVELQVFSWEEEGTFFVYAPAFDLTGYGKSQVEANDSFRETMAETIDYMEHKSTIFDELERLGWMVNRRKKRVQAPDLETMLSENDELAEIQRKPGVTSTSRSLEFALA